MDANGAMSGEILGLTSQNSSVSKSNQLQVVSFRVFFDKLRYILQIPLIDQWISLSLELQPVVSQTKSVHL